MRYFIPFLLVTGCGGTDSTTLGKSFGEPPPSDSGATGSSTGGATGTGGSTGSATGGSVSTTGGTSSTGGVAGNGGSRNLLCTQGDTKQCVGPGACTGGQTCLPNGSGWTQCDCGGGTGGNTGGTGGNTGTADAGPCIELSPPRPCALTFNTFVPVIQGICVPNCKSYPMLNNYTGAGCDWKPGYKCAPCTYPLDGTSTGTCK